MCESPISTMTLYARLDRLYESGSGDTEEFQSVADLIKLVSEKEASQIRLDHVKEMTKLKKIMSDLGTGKDGYTQ